MSGNELLAAGDLDGWIASLTQTVKSSPTNAGARFNLAQGLMLAGQIERADNQLDLVMSHDVSWAPKCSMIRQLLRGLKSREEFYAQGRAPEVLKTPDGYLAALLEANTVLRTGTAEEASEVFERAETLRKEMPGTCDGASFDTFRDLDDRTAGVLEVVTSNGKYYWIELTTVRELIFSPKSGILDLALRQVEIDVEDGPTGVVFLPVIYHQPVDKMTAEVRLGRMSEWSEGETPPIIGEGRRCMLIGDDVRALGDDMEVVNFGA